MNSPSLNPSLPGPATPPARRAGLAASAAGVPLLFILLWSSGYAAGRFALPHTGPFTLLSLRFGIAALVLLLLSLASGAPWPRGARAWGHLAVTGLLMQVLHFAGIYYGLRQGLTAGVAGLLIGLMPLATALGAHLWLAERLGRRQLLGLAGGLLGVALVVSGRPLQGAGGWPAYAAALLGLAGVTSSVVTFVLAGFIIQTVCTAGISLALNLAPNPWAVNEIVNWLMGSLADRSVEEVRIAAPGVILGSLMLLTQGRALDALTLGEQGARSLGVSLVRTRLLLALGVSLAVGSSVAVTGVIGFVGLIVPHLLRPLVGARPGALLWPSLLGGAVLTLAADILVRMTPAANEIKLSVAMAALGGPFFLSMLIDMRRRFA